ncbi:MAG: hypothetical protein K2Y21_09720 [Phycisphaerales bacterium]|nr:hypothetical protein [Phycisphaerales bacterium]
MNQKTCIACMVAVVGGSAVSNPAGAAVTIGSVLTKLRNFSYPTSSGVGPPGTWDDSVSNSVAGASSLSLRGSVLKTNVTTSQISGTFFGDYYSSNGNASGTKTSLDVTLSVTAAPVNIQIKLNGDATPGGLKPFLPENLNAYFVIYNAVTNAIVFDSYTVGVHAATSESNDFTRWTNVVWNGQLGPGQYRVLAGADGDQTLRFGPGAPSSGSGRLDASMDIVIPGPGGVGLLLASATLLTPRRRPRTGHV